MAEPKHHRGESKQDYCTPDEFLDAVRTYLNILEFDCDLAASDDNCVCLPYFTEKMNSIGQNWKIGDGYNWCNPPFENIQEWVKKAGMEWQFHQARTIMLLPAGVGSNWFRDYCHNITWVLFLNGRITFKGAPTCYPKDCMLVVWGAGRVGYDIWSWRQDGTRTLRSAEVAAERGLRVGPETGSSVSTLAASKSTRHGIRAKGGRASSSQQNHKSAHKS